MARATADEENPAWTLIEWAWSCGFEEMEERRAELAALTLTWFFTTTRRPLRDQATKALASLLAVRPGLAAALLGRFWDVDDDYLRERLVAAVYGALLQNKMDRPGISTVSRAQYRLIFEDQSPPVNALLRDHGRGVMEYALWKACLPAAVDMTLARPPYRSPWLLEQIPDDVIESYTEEYRGGSRFGDAIVGSA